MANKYRSDVAPGSHGYRLDMDWRPFVPGTYKVYSYGIGKNGNNPLLTNSPKTYTVSASSGCVDYVNESGIGGWAWKSAAPNLPIKVNILVLNSLGDNIFSTSVEANQYRSDLKKLGYGNGYHGFNTSIPWSYIPQGDISVIVYAVDGSGNNPTIYNSKIKNPYKPDYSYENMANNLARLENAIEQYKSSCGNKTSTTELELQYIRPEKYNEGNWSQAAGPINKDMVNYINSIDRYKDLQYYFYDNGKIIHQDPFTGARIDSLHMFGTLNILVHTTNYGGPLAAVFTEPVIDDLGGWAGDLEQFLRDDIIKQCKSYENDKSSIYNKSYNLILQNTSSSFGLTDFNADVDAVYLNKLLKNQSLSDAFKNYYADKNKKRYTLFCVDTNGAYSDNLDFLLSKAYGYVALDQTSIGIRSPLLEGYKWTSAEANAVAQAFRDRCKELMDSEN